MIALDLIGYDRGNGIHCIAFFYLFFVSSLLSTFTVDFLAYIAAPYGGIVLTETLSAVVKLKVQFSVSYNNSIPFSRRTLSIRVGSEAKRFQRTKLTPCRL